MTGKYLIGAVALNRFLGAGALVRISEQGVTAWTIYGTHVIDVKELGRVELSTWPFGFFPVVFVGRERTSRIRRGLVWAIATPGVMNVVHEIAQRATSCEILVPRCPVWILVLLPLLYFSLGIVCTVNGMDSSASLLFLAGALCNRWLGRARPLQHINSTAKRSL